MYFFLTRRELFLGTTVDDMYLGAQTQCCTRSVHGYVTSADYGYLFAVEDRGIVVLIKCLHQVISGQELVRGEYAAGCLSRNTHKLRKSCAGSDKYSVKAFLLHQLVDGYRLSDDNVSLDLNAERFYILYLRKYDAVLRKTELRNTVYQNAACFMQRLKNSYVITQLCQVASAGQTCRTGTDDRNLLAILLCGSCRLDALLSRPVGYKTLQLTDGNCLALDTADAASLTLALLGTYTSADSRKCGRLADYAVCFCKVAFLYCADEIRNMNLYRAAFHTFCFLTSETSLCLFYCLVLIVTKADLIEIRSTNLRILLSYRNLL